MSDDALFLRMFESVIGPQDEQALGVAMLKLATGALGAADGELLSKAECAALVLELRRLRRTAGE